jgi:hypothetical protein
MFCLYHICVVKKLFHVMNAPFLHDGSLPCPRLSVDPNEQQLPILPQETRCKDLSGDLGVLEDQLKAAWRRQKIWRKQCTVDLEVLCKYSPQGGVLMGHVSFTYSCRLNLWNYETSSCGHGHFSNDARFRYIPIPYHLIFGSLVRYRSAATSIVLGKL